jgi:2,3-bisphosphoglycerate-independent phosphoglycerate mutase
MIPANKPLVLMILDGWGYSTETENNAIAQARTPCWDSLWMNDLHCLIDTSGKAVGLPAGQMGNSEVGHMNIGAGRIVYQDFTRISKAIEDGSFQANKILCNAIEAANANNGTVHIMGLLSPGGVHSHDAHFLATVKLAGDRGADKISVHAFLDGRDTPPRSAASSIESMQELVNETIGATIDTVTGRYYAMDRDKRWDRVELAYHAIVHARAEHTATDACSALAAAYDRNESDEFVQPTILSAARGIKDGDSIIFVNFRADRARELTQALTDPGFDGFERTLPNLADFACMTQYLAGLPVSVAFPSDPLPKLLSEILSSNGLRQLRIAETEKYAHVTFFFNGGREEPFALEQRMLIQSPAVATYDLQPEMSAPELTRKLVNSIGSGEYDVIICNVANPDMVGHTGNMNAAVKAVETVDTCLAVVIEAIDSVNGEILITADHGNVEQMTDPESQQVHTAHTSNPVPLIFHGRAGDIANTGSLRDLAPTMLYLLGLPQPQEMTGRSLLVVA